MHFPVAETIVIVRDASFGTAIVAAALAASLSWFGAWYLQGKGERRARRSRLKATELELRENKIVVEAVLAGNQVPTGVSNEIWDRLRVELALDVPEEGYEQLSTAYFAFDRSAGAYVDARNNVATPEEKQWLLDWVDELVVAQVYVTAELHAIWKLKAKLALTRDRVLKGLRGLAGRRKAPDSTSEEV